MDTLYTLSTLVYTIVPIIEYTITYSIIYTYTTKVLNVLLIKVPIWPQFEYFNIY